MRRTTPWRTQEEFFDPNARSLGCLVAIAKLRLVCRLALVYASILQGNFAYSSGRKSMKQVLIACVLALAGLSIAAHAAEPSCEARATEKKLAGAAKASFMKKCERDTGAAAASSTPSAPSACETQAAEKKLAGAAKASFIKKCAGDTKATGAQSACEAQAAEKKLAGAAKASFIKKCAAGN